MTTKIYKLYLKESPFGLKYLGKTIRDPFDYMGSGTIWKRHIKKYNLSKVDIKTTILFETTDKDKFKQTALKYSNELNVVESNDFANLTHEEGQGGTTVTKELRPDVCERLSIIAKKRYIDSPEIKEKLREWMKLNNPMNSEESRKRVSESLKGHTTSTQTRNKIKKTLKEYYKINSVHNKGVPMNDDMKNHLSEKMGNPIFIDNVKYNSIRHASRILGISRYLISKKLEI